MDENNRFLKTGTRSAGLVTGIAFALIALMLIFIGFFKTLFVTAAFGLGWFIGRNEKKEEAVRKVVNRLIPPKNE